MVLEIADITIVDGKNAEFDLAITRGVTEVVARASGFLGFKIQKGIESPNRYLLMIEWSSLDDHMVGFRNSPAFQEWRAIVGPFFAGPPKMEHFQLLEV
jgi:heme-degrading monooxygenase HmoA